MPFRLLSDPDRRVSEAYGARRAGLGRLLPVPRRISYLIDPEGRVVRSYRVARPASHADRVLSDLRGLAGPGRDRPS